MAIQNSAIIHHFYYLGEWKNTAIVYKSICQIGSLHKMMTSRATTLFAFSPGAIRNHHNIGYHLDVRNIDS